jgi:dolichyl-phosphate beta-glucosyltransferase
MSSKVKRCYLSIVIPSYNEEKRLAATLENIRNYLDRKKLDAEVIVVDDGSTDGTKDIARQFEKMHEGCKLISNEENKGKGFSFRRGFLSSRGNFVLLTDADLSAPIEEYERLMEESRRGDYDLVFGSRALDDSRIEIKQSFVRRLMGKIFNGSVRFFTGLPFKDTQCGFKLLAREKLKPVVELMRIDRFSFDVELIFLAWKLGLRVKEVAVVWRDSPRSKVKMASDSWNMFLDIMRIKRNYKKGLYGRQEVAAEDL